MKYLSRVTIFLILVLLSYRPKKSGEQSLKKNPQKEYKTSLEAITRFYLVKNAGTKHAKIVARFKSKEEAETWKKQQEELERDQKK